MDEQDTRPRGGRERDAPIRAATGTCYVGVDGTSAGSAALAWALRRGAHRGDPIVLVHVLDADQAGSADADADANQILQGALEASRRLAPQTTISGCLLRGSVARDLAGAPSVGDMLVIGTNKTGYLRGRLVGSRSVFIATTARCSVAVIPYFDQRFRRGVLVGVDGLGAPLPAITCGAGEAERLGEQLTLLSAVPPPSSDRAIDAADETSLEAALLHAAALAGVVAPEVVTRVARRGVADALLDAAARASLLVLGASHGHRPQSVAGPVAHDVLLNINSPVIIARDRA